MTMTDETLDNTIITLIAEQMGVPADEINRSTHLENDLHADSLDSVELVMELEDEFEMSITDDEWETVVVEKGTVGDLCDYIRDRVG